MREGTASRVMAADRPYGKFYDFYSISPENFGSTLIYCTGFDVLRVDCANEMRKIY